VTRPGETQPTEESLTGLFQEEWPRLVSAGLRITGDLQAAEDVVQETLLTALDRWPLQGIPDSPGAWLMTACRNRARNAARDAGRERRALTSVQPAGAAQEPPDPDPAVIEDDQMRLIALCCHPALGTDAQIALTLRMVGGLSTEEIARGFHQPVTAIAQRIVRAKRTLRQHQAGLSDAGADLAGRLPAVLDVVYLIFNEGYLATGGQALTRGELAFEAYRLACLLTRLAPGLPEPWALLGLLSFQLSRWVTRTGPDGAILTLDAQDRARWNAGLIADGTAALGRARGHGQRGPLLLQAELAACHATAPTFEQTDWAAIVILYDELARIQDTPVVSLNRAVAVAMRDGPAAGIALLDPLTREPVLAGSHRVWAVRADLHRRAGDHARAADDYDRALHLVTNDAERRYLAAARSSLPHDQARQSGKD